MHPQCLGCLLASTGDLTPLMCCASHPPLSPCTPSCCLAFCIHTIFVLSQASGLGFVRRTAKPVCMCTIDAHVCVPLPRAQAQQWFGLQQHQHNAARRSDGPPAHWAGGPFAAVRWWAAYAWVCGLRCCGLRPACVSTALLLMWFWRMSWLKFCLHACSHLEQAVAASCSLSYTCTAYGPYLTMYQQMGLM